MQKQTKVSKKVKPQGIKTHGNLEDGWSSFKTKTKMVCRQSSLWTQHLHSKCRWTRMKTSWHKITMVTWTFQMTSTSTSWWIPTLSTWWMPGETTWPKPIWASTSTNSKMSRSTTTMKSQEEGCKISATSKREHVSDSPLSSSTNSTLSVQTH